MLSNDKKVEETTTILGPIVGTRYTFTYESLKCTLSANDSQENNYQACLDIWSLMTSAEETRL
jgi:hypothetical protein